MRKHSILSGIALAVSVAVAPNDAQAQIWTQWTSSSPGSMSGSLGGTAVTYTGARAGEQLYGGGGSVGAFNYFASTAAYTQNGLGAPPLGFIQFNAAVSQVTISFAQAVVNPYMAFISVGQPTLPVTYSFDGSPTFAVVSNNNWPNCTVFGCGSYETGAGSITGREFSGVIQFQGTFNSITFSTSPNENWHGVTVGAASISTVPEPSTYALLGAGLLGMFGVARKRRPTA